MFEINISKGLYLIVIRNMVFDNILSHEGQISKQLLSDITAFQQTFLLNHELNYGISIPFQPEYGHR